MTPKLAVCWLALGSFATVLPVFAQGGPAQAVEVTRTERVNFPPGGTVRLIGSYGYLSVDGWDEPQIEVTLAKTTNRLYRASEQDEAKRRLELIRVVTERRSDSELSITTTRPSRHGIWAPPLPPTTDAGVTVEIRLHVPRTSRLIVHHDTGYLWISDVTGEIEATGRTGDMIVMLPSPAQFAIDAKSRIGTILSDIEGDARSRFLLGRRFNRMVEGPPRRIYLRMGRGNITIKQIPAPWSPKNN